jgi:hypothetical protein
MSQQELMIPNYPEFTKLDIEHKDTIRKWTTPYEPYSDFNFISLFSWNISNDAEISLLNDNLVIRIPDYITQTPVVSLLGQNMIAKSLKTLLEQQYEIKLVPQATIDALSKETVFTVTHDRNNDDYIYDLHAIADLPGGSFKKKRNKLNTFMTKYGDKVSLKEVDLNDGQKVVGLKSCFDKWADGQTADTADTRVERQAIDRLLDNARSFDLRCYEAWIGDKLVGFSINEVLPDGYAICHFQKAHVHHINLDIYINVMVAKELLNEGCEYVNWEQDLGIEGLRLSKTSYRPIKFLQKYKLSSSINN